MIRFKEVKLLDNNYEKPFFIKRMLLHSALYHISEKPIRYLENIPNSLIITQDKTKKAAPWYKGLRIDCIYTEQDGFYNGELCTDKVFTKCLLSTGLNATESIEVQQLPSLTYMLLPLSQNNQPLFGLQDWFMVGEGEVGILKNPAPHHVFATWGLMHCVSVAIFLPDFTFFAHVSKKNLEENSGFSSFIQQISPFYRQEAKVMLVSSYYSEVFAEVYQTLQRFGFKKMAADIEATVNNVGDSWEEAYIKASTLGTYLELYEDTPLLVLQNNLQKHFPVPGERAFIINAKTGTAYALKDRHERHLESDILYDWDKQYNLSSHFSSQRFRL